MKRRILFVCALLVSQWTMSQVLVEAESFTDKGGWVSDHQAFEQIQSSYLMAHGLGRPVKDAVTSVSFSEGGKYHLYVSTYNWTAPWYKGKGPGAFQVLVNG
ncbi:MAG: pyridine nucleotide-disulfide oxidoreductase, partial [Alistipes sp.]|nr:pyridine nucleotide-disulfide oxidoreductase [Alistipes sp.]